MRVAAMIRRGAWPLCLLAAAACSPGTPEELMNRARSALAAGEPRTAEIHLKNLLEREPGHAEARRLLGELLLAGGDAAGAEHQLLAALDHGADAAAVKLPLLRALLAQGKLDAVLQRIAAAPEPPERDRAEVLAIAGAAHRARRSLPEAEAAYRAAAALEPGSAGVRTELAAVLFEAGKGEEAAALLARVRSEQPDFVPAILLEGSTALAAGRLAEAERLFERVATLEAERTGGRPYAVALAQAIEAELAQQKIAEAAAHADALLAAAPASPVARYLKARVEDLQGNQTGAERRLEGVITDAANYWPAYLLLGTINARQGELGQAEMYLRAAVNNDAGNVPARLLLAEIYLRQSNPAAARELLERAPPEAMSDGLLFALAGRSSLGAGYPELAAELFERSEQSGADDLRDLMSLTGVYLAAAEWDRAVRVLESASFADRSSEQAAAYLLTLVQLRRGDVAAAQASAARLAAQNPEAAWAASLSGAVQAAAGDLAAARTHYARAAELDPNHLPALLGLARVALTEGRPAEAHGLLGRAFQLEPSARLALEVYAVGRQAGERRPEWALLAWAAEHPADVAVNYALAGAALDAGDHAAAAARYEAVLAADAQHVAALNNLAWIYGERGDPRALELASRARALRPQDPAIADTLGWLHVRRGDVSAGLPLLEEAARGAPDEPEIQYHLAAALAESGDAERAAAVLEQALAANGRFPSRDAAAALRARLAIGRSP